MGDGDLLAKAVGGMWVQLSGLEEVQKPDSSSLEHSTLYLSELVADFGEICAESTQAGSLQ